MKTFLEYVAADIINKYGTSLSRTAVVFPNKRASLFMNEHLARLAGRPLWSPAYITISDLFRQHSPLTVGDPIKLICDLHKSFTACTGIDETLDHFYGWGQLLLADFDDIDKNMADAQQVFANLRDLHEYDDISYLTPEQTAMLKRFFASFSDSQDSKLKQKFLELWSHFYDIYQHFRQHLQSQNIAYEGMLYRDVAENPDLSFDYDRYLFVGFNMMQRVERVLCSRLMKDGKARFYWDFDKYYIQQNDQKSNNEAGQYISQYLKEFPNELDTTDADIYDNLQRDKQIRFISAATENIQARYISTWLREGSRMADGRRTALVLCNENLLQTAIHCLPPEVEKVNITTGYPLSQTPLSSLVNHLIALQTVGYSASRNCFRLHYINQLLNHPYVRFLSPLCEALQTKLNEEKIYYPTPEQLSEDASLQMLFSPLSGELLPSLSRWLLQLTKRIAQQSSSQTDEQSSPLLQESLFRLYTLLNRLNDLITTGDLCVDIITFQRLLVQLIQSTSIPFHGEPAEGLQLMGVLETRNLDFDHLLILSCNEGNMPRGVNDASFIPYAIRKAFGLTTIDHKVGIYAYYFYRLLQRASDITILYNNSTEDGHTGEMSRFMLQLIVESPNPIEKKTLMTGQTPLLQLVPPIEKTEDMMQRLRQKHSFSPTAINNYLRCPLRFYYGYVAGLQEQEYNDDDDIDNRIFGNIFHHDAEIIYRQLKQKSPVINTSDLEELLKHPHPLEMAVDKALREDLFHLPESSTKLPPLNGLQIIKREVIIKYLKQLLQIDLQLTPFTIAGLEKKVEKKWFVGDIELVIGGIIDRLDIVGNEADGTRHYRVIDYKTGHNPKKTPTAVDDVFNPELLSDAHTDYYLQAMLYSFIVSEQQEGSSPLPVSPALLFIQHASKENYDPTLKFGKTTIYDIEPHREAFTQLLNNLLAEIFNPEQPFTPTENRKNCKNCPYRMMCVARS